MEGTGGGLQLETGEAEQAALKSAEENAFEVYLEVEAQDNWQAVLR